MSTAQASASPSGTKHVLVPIADGTEEVEATSIITVLRRGGVKVTVASVEESPIITGARSVKLCADDVLSSPSVHSAQYDGIFLPGGAKGAEHLRDCPALISLLRTQHSAGRLYGAICASPATVLSPHHLLPGKAVGHPGFAEKLVGPDGAVVRGKGERVVWDAEWNCVTSVGPGSALEFGLAVLGRLMGQEKVSEVAAPMTLGFTPSTQKL